MSVTDYDPEANGGQVPNETEMGAQIAEDRKEARKRNLSDLISNPNTRPKIIMFSVVILFVGFIGLMLVMRGGSEDMSEASIAAPSTVPTGQASLTDQTSPEYARIESEANRVRAEQAARTGGTHIELPSPQVPKVEVPEITQADQERIQNITQPDVNVIQPAQLDRVNNWDRAVSEQMRALLEVWTGDRNRPGFTLVQQPEVQPETRQQIAGQQNGQWQTNPAEFIGQQPPLNVGEPFGNNDMQLAAADLVQATGGGLQPVMNVNATQVRNNAPLPQAGPGNLQEFGNVKPNAMIKAGTLYYGTTDFEVNTDDPGEVLATIHNGPLKGSKMIGSFQKGKDTVSLRFSLLSAPFMESSVSINAVAVHPETGRRGMASEVDNHYFERYGLLLASAFIQGMGEAASRANSTISTSPLGSTQVQGEIDPSDRAIVAAGRAGATLSSELQRNSTVQQTVSLHQGEPLGILFLSDMPVYIPGKN